MTATESISTADPAVIDPAVIDPAVIVPSVAAPVRPAPESAATPATAPATIPAAIPAVKEKARGDRLAYVEPIRAYAMSIVVFIHVAAILAPHFKTVQPHEWWIANFYHALSKGGPPIFTIVSGALLLGISKDQPLMEFFRKRFVKVLIPFLGWAAVYLAWRATFKGESLTPNQMLQALLGGSVYDHLWFIQMILGLYLATPILRIYVQNASRASLRYFLIVWFVGVACLPTVSRLLAMPIKLDLVVMTGYTGYFILGYYLREVSLKAKQAIPVLLVAAGMLMFTQYATYALMMAQGGKFDAFFLNNQGFNIVILAGSVFLFLKSLPWPEIYHRFPLVRKTITLLASCSLGVYFVHVLIMELLGSGKLGFALNSLTIHPIIGIPLTSVVTLILSVMVVLVLKRIPFVKMFVP